MSKISTSQKLLILTFSKLNFKLSVQSKDQILKYFLKITKGFKKFVILEMKLYFNQMLKN
jgi:hypothetical protein